MAAVWFSQPFPSTCRHIHHRWWCDGHPGICRTWGNAGSLLWERLQSFLWPQQCFHSLALAFVYFHVWSFSMVTYKSERQAAITVRAQAWQLESALMLRKNRSILVRKSCTVILKWQCKQYNCITTTKIWLYWLILSLFSLCFSFFQIKNQEAEMFFMAARCVDKCPPLQALTFQSWHLVFIFFNEMMLYLIILIFLL